MKTAKLFERLLTESCKSQVQQAIKYEGQSTIESAFQVLGQVAARGLFSNPSVAGFIAQLGNHVDSEENGKRSGCAQETKLIALFKSRCKQTKAARGQLLSLVDAHRRLRAASTLQAPAPEKTKYRNTKQ